MNSISPYKDWTSSTSLIVIPHTRDQVVAKPLHCLVFSPLAGSLLSRLLLGRHDSSHLEGVQDIRRRDVDCVEWEENPDHIEENQINPLIHEITSIEVDVAREPLGAKRHEALRS